MMEPVCLGFFRKDLKNIFEFFLVFLSFDFCILILNLSTARKTPLSFPAIIRLYHIKIKIERR